MSILEKLIIIPLSNFLNRHIKKWIESWSEPKERAEVTQEELWALLQKYRKTRKIEAEEYLILANYKKYLLQELNLIK